MMNPKIKDFIGVMAGVGVIGFILISWMYVSAFSKSIEPSSFRSFAVSAKGDIVTIPDVAQFTFSVITQGGTNIASLQQENTEKTNKAINFVKAQGVEAKDIKTQNFSLQPRYQNFSCPRSFGGEVVPCPPAEIVGYSITQTVQVKIRDFAKIGEAVSGVVDNGANSVSQLSFTIDDRDKSESDARTEAIEKAKEKAKSVAQAGGFKLGRLLSIQESGDPFYPVYQRAFDSGFGGAVAESAPAPNIEPGSQEVTINVTLVYEIQ